MLDQELVGELKRSKKSDGEIYPILYARFPDSHQELIAGSHRKESGWKWVEVRDVQTREEFYRLRISSNIQHLPNDKERAIEVRKLCEAILKERKIEKKKIGAYVLKHNLGLGKNVLYSLIPNEFKLDYSARKDSRASKVEKEIDAPVDIDGTTVKATDAAPEKPKHPPLECPHDCCRKEGKIVYLVSGRLVIELVE